MRVRIKQAGRRSRSGIVSGRLLCTTSLSALMLIALPSVAHAQNADRNWDANSTAAGNGGTGTWDTTGSNWSPNSDGTSGPYVPPWNNTLLDNAIFGGTAGTVTVGVPITVHNITFNTANYTLAGNTLTLAGTAPTIAVNSGTSTITSTLAGSAGLTKTGVGVLLLTGTNTFSGGITLSGGNLRAANNAGFGDSGNIITTTASATLTVDGGTTNRAVSIGAGTTLTAAGAGVGSALFTGSGNLNVSAGLTLNNDASTYTGTTQLNGVNNGVAHTFFTSVRNIGEASSLGAGNTITFAGGSQFSQNIHYIGDGDTSNRNWAFGGSTTRVFNNDGSGTLTLTGGLSMSQVVLFLANSGNFELLGVISGTPGAIFSPAAGRTITLGGAHTFTGAPSVAGTGVVIAPVLANSGVASSLGSGSAINLSGTLSYTGAAISTDRTWTASGTGNLLNDGTGALNLTGAVSLASGKLTLGGAYAGTNTISGVISGSGGLASSGGIWALTGANSYTGVTTVSGGTLRAGSVAAFGTTTSLTVNSGTLDLNGFNMTTASLTGTGGTVALGSGNLTLNAASGSTIFAGSITGTGGLTKLGASTFTLSGQSSYTGATTIGGGGTLGLNFTAVGAPASNIISSSSPLVMSGGTLSITGDADGSSQTFGGLTVTAGNNKINATAGAGALTVNLGAITRSGGLIDFAVPTSANILTSNADGALGGWATITSGTTIKTTDYAQVIGGVVVPFAAYVNKDNAATWLDGEILSDEGGAANTQFTGTVSGSKQIGGLKYTVPVASTVNISAGQTLGIDGTIIVSSSVGAANQTINGGSLTGGTGGSTLGVLNNSTGVSTFTIGSTIVDNGGATSFAKSGTGIVALSGLNTYTGGTTISGGTLSVNSIANGGQASAIGAAGSSSDNLVIEGSALQYTGVTTTSDRGFTLVTSGAVTAGTIGLTNAGANLTFSGLVTSPDNAGLTKTGVGTLTLANAGNDYVGVTTIAGGTIAATTLANGGANSSIGASSNASANLVLQGGGALGYLGATASSDRGFTLGTGGGGIDVGSAATTLTLSGTAVGTGSLTKTGAGTLVLSGTNTYSGGTTISAGTLRAGSANPFGTGLMTLANTAGATLDLNGFNATMGALQGGGPNGGNVILGAATLTLSGGTGTYAGVISGTGKLSLASVTQTMTGCNNIYTGGTTITGSTLSVDCLANGGLASGIGSSPSATANLAFNVATLQYTGGSISIDRGFTLTGLGALEVTNAGTTLGFSGQVVGAAGLRKDGPGTLVLSGTNTYAGGTTITGGILRAGSTSAFGTGGMALINGVTLDLNGFNNSVAFLNSGAGNSITLGSATLTINNPSGQTSAGTISGTGALIKSGAGTQILSGCGSSYTGGTTITAGQIDVQCLADGGSNSSIGASAAGAGNLVLNGGTLAYVGTGGSTNRQFTLGAAGTLNASGSGAINFTGTAPITLTGTNAARTLTLTGTSTANNSLGALIADNGTGKTALTKTGVGTWILTNPGSTYTGITTISGGVLGVDKLSNGGFASSIGASGAAASNLIIGNGSTLRYTGAGDTTNRLFTLSSGVTFIESSGSGAVVFTDTGPVTLQTVNVARTIALGGTNTGNNTLAGSIGNAGTGVTTLAKNDAGTWVLTGTHTYTGPTNINAGILNIGGGGTTGSVASAIINNFGTLGFNRSDTATYAGTITGTGAVQQLGAGTTILTGTSNYTGGTIINAGTLQLGSGAATGSIVGNATNNGTLTFNRNNAYTFGGTISGTGQVTQIGSGTTILTGTNSYSGGTSITTGTLQVSSDANLGAGSGGLTFNDGTLRTTASMAAARAVTLTGGGTFLTDPATTLTLNGLVAGAGTLTKTGTGTLTLAADNSYTGLTTISAGTLRIGSGGATGSISGNVLNNGAFVFDRSNSLTHGGTITGSGTVTQAGSGTTILTGTNSYAGATDISAGTLRINGNQSGATGLTTVFNGATLGGSGTVGGSVLVQNGGTLAPGNSPGTLTINGDLSLSAASLLNFEFGQADVVGGPLNDLVNVGGNLTLDGTINVSVPAGGSFGGGIYRVFNYGGTLIDNGLSLGTMPGGSNATVQTSVAGQVNLINSAGLALSFWDGNAGPKFNGLIDGGSGSWHLGGVDNNWTDSAGGINAGYADGTFAIFAGTGGTVTVDNSSGTVTASGMQFASNGYTVTGNPLTLVGPQSTIRVGDGTPTGAGFTATIAAQLAGATQLVKTDLGTLILTGANSYSGGTAINGGTLQISNDANLGAAGGAITFDGGTLRISGLSTARAVILNGGGGTFQTNGITVLSGAITGTGPLTKTGTSLLTLTGTNTYTGGTTISAGTLALGNGGTGSIVGDVINNAQLTFNRSGVQVFAGLITGSGVVRKIGAGTDVLTNNNSYSGATNVVAGSLLINGDQTAATGLTSVSSGATLGGTGTIGGNVTLAAGATLAPSDATGPGTLTINGNLALAGTSRLDYEFGRSNVVGGPLNDLTQVGGNLILDGTIDVTVSGGGNFGPGLYRVVSFGGTLTDNGLATGALPPGALVAVQTSITGQVNLVNATGATLNFWDGSAPVNEANNLVDGGSGTWQNSSGNNDWTNTAGQVNGPYSDGSFAIFAAASGTVSVDDSLGAVTASGLQFASDGYALTGQDLTLVGPESTIRVGDGTTVGLGFTATIDAALIGGTQLVKADLGTLVLTGTNSYTGGTRIDAGTLRVSSDANLGDAAGGLGFNGGTLNTTADISSNRIVDLISTGTFRTDGGSTLAVNGVVSGAGGLTKDGAGSLMLTGANSYGGNTVVAAGSLFVNGDQSATPGLTSVSTGATLGGSGIVGGNVSLADGGTLAAGMNNVGTLTINGDLALSAGTLLAFEFGQANVPGGTLNDLVDVGGNLTLDGTINVSVPASGTFGPGIYRVFNYGGTLTDNGLALGTLPGGSAVSVQTAVAGQVNLVNTAGLTLSFWDGAAGPKNNGLVNGGSGVWRVGGGSNNWTDANGALNADYAQSSFAIFSAAPGTVNVDNVGGAVLASGMQFASDGYVVTGAPLTLTGGQALIQVGDGSAAGAGYGATISAELTGSAGVVKTDLGTLVLTGTNSYTGGTTIDGGTLQIGNGGATGSVTGDIANNGALVVDRSGTIALDGTISGTGALTKLGSGVLTLSGANSYAGGTTVGGGTLQVSSDANLGNVAGTLSLQGGILQAAASFTSARAILLGSTNANSIDTQGFNVMLSGTIGDGPNNSSGDFVNKLGTGTLTLTGANTYNNRTVIAGGTLALADAGTIGAGNLVVGAGTVFDISQTNTGARVIQLNSGPAGTIALGSKTLTLGFGNSSSDWSGSISDGGIAGGTGGSVVIAAPNGVVRFFEANGYTGGTTVASGTFVLGGNGSLYSGGAVAVNGGSVFDISALAGTGTTIGDLSGAGTIALGGKSLTFGTANSTTFSGTISGIGGALVKNGTGTFTLGGANGYTGATDANAGTLLVNGNQTAATGLTSVGSGATLGGTGTIGGTVIVADGATLAPGASGSGALTINGSLALSGGSTLAYEFGAANAVGSPLNDVVNVGGNLTLGGTLNVAVTPGGAFDIGLYRIANYGGTLTNNGLAFGMLPAGADVFVQTSVANEVNLINTGGATLNFWDGAAGPKFNGAVNGGDGVWQNGTGNNNWADISGAVNAGYADGAFAIFTGAPGTVTIDNGLGAVTASGLQFATDGYTVTGGALTLTGPQSVIRVGDGTGAGAGYTATIAADLTGTAQLVKTDLGTLVLTGTNSYSGGTAINGGTIRIASDANLGDAAGGLSLDGGTLNTTADLVSARAVTLAGSSAFLTDAGTTLTLGGAVSGVGGLTKGGTGTLMLTGTGSYAGATNVGAGTLLVNGDYAGATGASSIASGASLGGTGTTGGDVTLASGATLTPGAGGAGTLIIKGNLSLAAGTTLAYEFGQANVAGGALNDLVKVGGDLTLDGTINVTVPTGGAFDAGIYRVFDYAGTLTNNGLTLGALPAGSTVAVQTSVAGQVNLVNFAGLALSFWDGAAGPKNNGVINGGTGIWQNGTATDNWTDAPGAINAAYTNGAFAVFGGTGGTVTVDNGAGQVTASGMQFASQGYTITGGEVALTGPQATIRVGDGSPAAGYTATINSVLSGATQLVKTDAGTLVLGGTNSYTGGTLINGGTVQISSDANLGAVAGNVTLDGATLANSANVTSARGVVMAGAGTLATADATTFTLDGQLSGTGALTKAGSGTLLLTGNNSGYTTTTTVAGGTLAVTGTLGGAVAVNGGGRLEGTGQVGSVTNGGVVAPGRDGFGTLTVAGYTGSGGRLEIETALGGDGSPTDRLVVNGTTAGTTAIDVVNRDGLGAQTVGGIKIVDVTGASNGTFTLNGDYVFQGDQAVIAGAYGYRLYQGGVTSATDGDWYLRSSLLNGGTPDTPDVPLYQPGVPIYEAYNQTLLTLTDLGTMQERIGNRQWARSDDGKALGIWGRMQSNRSRPNAVRSTSLSDVNIDSWKMELGADHVLSARGDGATLVLGVLGSYGEANASIASLFGNGSIKTKGYSAGATLSWFGPQGFYVDSRAQVTWFDSKLKSTVLGTLVDGNDGTGQAYSVEIGKRAPIGKTLSVTPQIQMVYTTVGFDRFTDPNDAVVSSKLGDSLKTRWGILLDRQDDRSRLYAVGNLSYEWLDGTVTDVSGKPLARENHRLWGELGLGGSVTLGDRLTLYSEVSANTAVNDFGKSYSLKGTAGLRLAF